MVSKFRLDTRETPDEERLGLWALGQARQRFAPTFESWDSIPRPAPSSSLAAVDALLPYEPFSYQLRGLISTSLDNVRSAFLYIEKTGEIPMLALYSMIRAAVEASSYGIWMLSAGQKNKQAFLSLRLTYANNESLDGLAKVFTSSGDPAPDLSRVRKRLLELQQAINNYRSHDITQTPTTTNVVMEADRSLAQKRTLLTGLQVWKSCSGIAHGNSAITRTVLEHAPTGEEDDLGITMMLTSRVTVLAVFLLVAVENLEQLLSLYATSAAPANAGLRRP